MNKDKTNKIVYGWYHNEEIFYVGIGTYRRSTSTCGRNRHCLRKRRKAEREGNFKIEIIEYDLTFEEACQKEIELIQQYGRLDLGTGCLTNMTDGGEGIKNASKETKQKISDKRKGFIQSQQTKDKISESLKGNSNGQGNKGRGIPPIKRKLTSREILKRRRENPRVAHNKIPVHTPKGDFECISDAVDAHWSSAGTIVRRLKHKDFPEYYYL